MTVAWDHSVEKTRWQEHYRVDGTNLRLTQARIRSFGAGMEPPPDATLRDGWWTWEPRGKLFPGLRLTRSPFTRDYELCWRARCESLRKMTTPSSESDSRGATGDDASIDVVDVRACRGRRAD